MKNIMNLTISNPANRYFNLSNPTKLIADAIYVFQKKKTLNKQKVEERCVLCAF